MKKSELIAAVAEASQCDKNSVKRVLDALAQTIGGALSGPGDSLTVPGIGKFKVVERSAEEAGNPGPGEAAPAPAQKAVKFKAAFRLE